MSRSKKLTRNGHLALGLAVPPALFLVAAQTGSGGRWLTIHTVLTLVVVGFGATALLCYVLAGQVSHPRVTHPTLTPTSGAPRQGE